MYMYMYILFRLFKIVLVASGYYCIGIDEVDPFLRIWKDLDSTKDNNLSCSSIHHTANDDSIKFVEYLVLQTVVAVPVYIILALCLDPVHFLGLNSASTLPSSLPYGSNSEL